MEFKQIDKKIKHYLKTYLPKESELSDAKYKLPLSDAFFCAQDRFRNQMFFKAIEAAMQKLKSQESFITVVDAGSGIGLLGAYALFLGADQCFLLEHNPHTLHYSKGLLEYLGYSERSEFIFDITI